MRNLKKFLALVMAMVMAFSLMLTASAAEVKPSTDFSDNDGITEAFVEAVDVLGGMKVYKGDDTGTLRPGSTITRAETAALIYRLATGDVDDTRAGLYANYGNFADVSENDWFAGYVGYCANAGYIKGHGGYFNPYGNVTGYEALAMVLRAIGYDKNHEFEGATWQTNVSALGTQLGILDDVKTTDYANTLHLASRRDVVASILFRAAAYVPMVNYTAMAGYDKWTNLIGQELNPTLGFKLFGLTNADGIVVGNQETGASATKFRFERDNGDANVNGIRNEPKGAKYVDNKTVNLKMETGLLEFGHKFNVWFDDTGRNESGTKAVYAAYDKVVKSELVVIDVTDKDQTVLANATADQLGAVAKKTGFSVGTKAYLSDSFRTILDESTSAGNWWNDQGLYLLVSNSSSKNLDLMISVNAEASKITRVDNISKTKSITVPTNEISSCFIDDTDNQTAVTIATNDSDTLLAGSAMSTAKTDAAPFDKYAWIKQDALTGNSSTTLGDYVIATGIGVESEEGHNMGTEIEGYQTHSIIKNVKEGQVVNYKTGATSVQDKNFNKDYVQLADGTKIEKSLFYYTVPGTETNNNPTTSQVGGAAIPQVYNQIGGAAAERYTNSTYRFYLDEHGRYVGAEPVTSTEFIYGTYADYSQAVSSSTFKYFMTGVNLQGEIVTKEFSTWANTPMTANGLKDLRTFFHQFDNGSTTGIGTNDNKYNGFMLTAAGGLYDDQVNGVPATAQILAPANQGIYKLTDTTDKTPIEITKAKINVGAVEATAAAVGLTQTPTLFLTEQTKFIVVSGSGTDTVKADVFNGITEFLGSSSQVDIIKHSNNDNDATRSDTYYTVSNEPYANVEGRYAREIDTIIINSRDVVRKGNFYFVPNFNDPVSPILTDINDPTLKLFTVYVGDQAQNVWLDTSDTVNMNDHSGYPQVGRFYDALTPTAKVTSNGEPVYVLADANKVANGAPNAEWVSGNPGVTIGNNTSVRYVATSRNSQTAYINDGSTNYLCNVANAKVVNLNPDKLPGITDLASLNEIASNPNPEISNYLRVWVVFTSQTGTVVDTIYVSGVA